MSIPKRRGVRWPILLLLLVIALAGGGWWWMTENIRSVRAAEAREQPNYVRFEEQSQLAPVLKVLRNRGLIRSSQALRLYATINRYPTLVHAGTYDVRASMSGKQILDALQRPIRQMVRIPETNWSSRTARYLEQKGVLNSEEYNRLVANPQEFKNDVSFPLPAHSLEGYLYPDTYDLPPLLGARQTIVRQLKAFERKVWKELDQPENLQRLITVASMVELEVARDEERPIVAGVIENRLRQGIPLQVDAVLMYGKGAWKPLTKAELKTPGPYNVYLNKGLPPGPICSPSIKSIKAALHPAKHSYLYYVAIDGKSYFASDYNQHLRNVSALRKAEAAERAARELQGTTSQ